MLPVDKFSLRAKRSMRRPVSGALETRYGMRTADFVAMQLEYPGKGHNEDSALRYVRYG